MTTHDREPSSREPDRLIYAGLLGLAAATLIQLVDKDTLNLAQQVGVYANAVAVPLLTGGLMTDYARRAGRDAPPGHRLLGLFGILAALVGLAAMFFHFGTVVGGVFLASAAVTIVLARQR